MRLFKTRILPVGCLLLPATLLLAQGQASSYDALVKQANAQLQSGNAAQALAAGQQAIKLDASRWEAYTVTGGALMNLKRYDEAIDQLKDALSRAPAAKQAALQGLISKCTSAKAGAARPVGPPASTTVTQAEIVLWKTIENSTKADDFRLYLKQYPQGAYVAFANAKLERITWNAIQSSTNVSDFQLYLTQYPGGVHAAQAQQQIAQLNAVAAQVAAQMAEQRRVEAAANVVKLQAEEKKHNKDITVEREAMVWTDTATGLMWEKLSAPMPGSTLESVAEGDYESAESDCKYTDWAGYTDWRLPTIEEWEAIYDSHAKSHTKGDLIDLQGYHTVAYDDLKLDAFWSSTSSSPHTRFYFDLKRGKRGEIDEGHDVNPQDYAKHGQNHSPYSSYLASLCVRSAGK